MFEPTYGQYYDTIQTENVARVNRIIERLNKEDRVYCILNDDETHIVVICQMEHDANSIATALIESGCSFKYHHMEFN